METIFGEFQHLRIQLEDIKSATDNFNDRKLIGVGGFGKVYEGELCHHKGRSMVAFKRLDRKFGQGEPEFWKEVMMLSRYTHENLISLLGFCDQGNEMILVYEHASNGSLDRHLPSTTFTWIRRIKTCFDAARGLSYLHDHKGTQQRVLHRDIKSSNILLDDNWNVKISDMGLSKIGPANQQHTALVTNVVGTLGYLDPMYMELGILTKESDVYSLGVVLFEVLCGRLCYDNSNGKFQSLVRMWKQKAKQKNLDEIIFQDLVQGMDPRSLEIFSDIAFQCLQKHREERPTMSVVVEKLETALEFQEIYEEMKHPLSYEKIIKTAVHPLMYKSEEELKSCLSKGILLNGGKTWFSLNNNGEHCEMISAAECIIRVKSSSAYDKFVSEKISRFPPGSCFETWHGVYKAHVRTQFLSPHITYTVNLVFKDTDRVLVPTEPRYVCIQYSMEGETGSCHACLADVREDGWMMAELFQFESERRNVDLEILFGSGHYEDWCSYLIEGIEFRPIEKVEHVVLEDDNVDMQTISESDDTYWEKKLPNNYDDIIKWSKDDLKWTTKKELYSILCKGFQMSNGQGWFSLAKNGKRCLMLPARYTLLEKQWKWKHHEESRFEDVAYSPDQPFSIVYNIKTEILSPATTYACYLVYKLPENSPEVLDTYEFIMQVRENYDDKTNWRLQDEKCGFIFMLNPQTPVIRPKAGQNSHKPMNRPKLKGIPKQRSDGWMEVQVWEFQTGTSMEIISMRVSLGTVYYGFFKVLTVQGIEFRPE
ncbi:putative protein kinase RLK-Pelle-CrRLK1L-1 family [Helianthus annuus]|nr:putative protein kinase RLK-Pelle-CrRLK1L-1 family [Helianthus annuus]